MSFQGENNYPNQLFLDLFFWGKKLMPNSVLREELATRANQQVLSAPIDSHNTANWWLAIRIYTLSGKKNVTFHLDWPLDVRPQPWLLLD